MSGALVLSLFPGGGFLDRAFESEGFCVVRAPDVLWGGDIRDFHPPPGVFDGIIGGDPCQSHSSLANLVRAKGLEPKFPDMTGDYARIVELARPAWFLRENVPRAPDIAPEGYSVTSFLLDNCWLGEAQMRKRRFWFGWNRPDSRWSPALLPAPNLRRWIPGVALEAMEQTQTAAADSRAVPVRLGGSGKVKTKLDQEPIGVNPNRQQKRTLADMLELQGFPVDYFGDHDAFTVQAKRRMVGNGVAYATGTAIAAAIKKALAER